MKEKVRIKDLVLGDVFELREVSYRVLKVTATEIIFGARFDNREYKEGGQKFSRGKNSQEFVNKITVPPKLPKRIMTLVRPPAEYSNSLTIGDYWRGTEKAV